MPLTEWSGRVAFERRWGAVGGVVLFFLVGAAISFVVAGDLLNRGGLQRDEVLGIAGAAAIGVILLILGCVMPVLHALTFFSETGVSQRGILRTKRILWQDVIAADTRIVLRSDKERIAVNVRYFRDPEAVLRFVRDHLPTSIVRQ